MITVKRFLTLSALIVMASMSIFSDNLSKLPKTEILGKEYYIYEVKKGETTYGISKRYGWDLAELLRLNPDAGGALQKGMTLYYPTGNITKVTEISHPVEISIENLEPIRHKVKKGETVYSISRQYGVPLEVIYKNNPTTTKGVKQGEIVTIPQKPDSKYYYHTVKAGETLSSISRTYNTNVEDILTNNPGLKVSNLEPGETIRITINSNAGKIKTEMVAEDRVTQISGYKVSKNETWDDISEKTGVEVEVLKEANSEDENPSENSIITVPVVESVEVERTVVYEEPENLSKEDVVEIYENIKGVDSSSDTPTEVNLALILDEPNSKKDIDFTRGMLVALSDFENVNYKINFKVIDGRVSSQNLIDELDLFEPNIIVSTADKAFPLFLADYGNTNNTQIVNVFDLKNDLYEDNASVIQILPPSSLFNERIAAKIYNDNKKRKLISVGEIDENDGIGAELIELFEDNHENMSLEEFGNIEPDILDSMLIYSFATKKEDVADFFTNVDNLSENYQGYDYKFVGRSNWIAMVDDFGDKFREYEIKIPARVWLNEESTRWKKFEESYDALFDSYPVRSIPNFAASGHDIASYFIPIVASNQGDFNYLKKTEEVSLIQTDIKLERVNNWGGFINSTGYLVEFRPSGEPEKILVQ